MYTVIGKYIHDDRCGNVGPFPAFRQLDCSNEVSEESWTFYLDYKNNCIKDSSPIPVPKPTPTSPISPVPVPKPSSKYVSPNTKPGVPDMYPYPTTDEPGDKSLPTPKKYIPPEEKGKKHHFRNFILICLVGGGGYWLYKRRQEFDYSRFRMMRARNYAPTSTYYNEGNNSQEMYSSLTLEESIAGSFQPPTLPPHPSAYGQNSGYSGP